MVWSEQESESFLASAFPGVMLPHFGSGVCILWEGYSAAFFQKQSFPGMSTVLPSHGIDLP